MAKEIIVPTFRGECNSYELNDNGFTSKRLNGEVLYFFEKLDSKPSAVKFEASSDKSDMRVSIQYMKNGEKDNNPDNLETCLEDVAGNGMFDLSGLKKGYYHLRAFAENAENVSFVYEFLN